MMQCDDMDNDDRPEKKREWKRSEDLEKKEEKGQTYNISKCQFRVLIDQTIQNDTY